MSKNKEPENNEISVGAKGLTLRGGVADDLRRPIKRAAGTADSVLRLIDNVVGLPTDFISKHLERFREKYNQEVEKIPLENRQQPPLRTGCSVLRHVAYSVEEPEIQEMFACLLATASDKERSSKAHPGFASVINDLTPEEANLLLIFSKYKSPIQMLISEIHVLGEEAGINDPEEVNRGISNLLRLGLVEWVFTAKQSPQEALNSIVGETWYHSPRSQEEVNKITIQAVNDLQNMKNAVVDALQQQDVLRELWLSSFGRQFIEACVVDDGK